MLNWWSRNFHHRVPGEIEEAAAAQLHGAAAQHHAQHSPAAEANPGHTPPPTPDEHTAPASGLGRIIDLESYDPDEGDRLRELKQIQAAKFAELREALKKGEDSAARETKYLKLCETIDKIESRVAARMQKRGLYVLRDDVERDLAASAELLRQSRESMCRRVLELCSSLDAAQRDEVRAAVESSRRSEERMLCMLPSLNHDDVLRELAS
jgi:hypothetical protein